jgi:hypothetical protein
MRPFVDPNEAPIRGRAQFTLRGLFMLTVLVGLLGAAYARLGTGGLSALARTWPSYTTARADGSYRIDLLPELALWAGLVGVGAVPIVAIVIVVYGTRTELLPKFLWLFPIAFGAMLAVIVAGKFGWRNAFWDLSAYGMLLMLLSSLFGLGEAFWHRLPKSAVVVSVIALLASISCYCLLVAIALVAGAAS